MSIISSKVSMITFLCQSSVAMLKQDCFLCAKGLIVLVLDSPDFESLFLVDRDGQKQLLFVTVDNSLVSSAHNVQGLVPTCF